MPRIFSSVRPSLAAVAAAALVPALHAQAPDTTRRTVPLEAVTVTATRSERTAFDTPQPITIIDSAAIGEKLPHGAVDLFRDLPGLDASGVGPNQRRPQIRGHRGQRILLLQDGLRLNNTRRQQDFGELPALAGISGVEQVEVVRGPSSVLYGTDAIGGVVNLITAGTPARRDGIHGEIGYRHGQAGSASTPNGHLAARFGAFSARVEASYRDARDYRAPAGTFGDIVLDSSVLVHDSGVRDRSQRLALGYDLDATSQLFARAELYAANRAGFGWIDPENFGSQTRVQITYPEQDFQRYTLGYRARVLSTPFANRAEISTYVQQNERFFNNDVFVPFSPTASMTSKSYNFTDLRTTGARVELAKQLGAHVLTYGLDAFRDLSEGTDSSVTTITGFGPPNTTRSNRPSIPHATFRSAGIFGQMELNPVHRLTAIVGARVQDIVAETKATPNTDAVPTKGSDRTAVWSANALYRVTDNLNLLTSVGRGFRAPNLVERFFEGRVVESNRYQHPNANLAPETSLNVDVGARYRLGPWFAEGFVFRNTIDDVIKAEATGETVNGAPAFQNRNIGRMRIDGLELLTGVRAGNGLGASFTWTRFDGKNITEPDAPVGDSYSSKLVGDVAYRQPAGRFMVGFTTRHQGEQRETIVGTNPIGPVIPAFTVHSARASVLLLERSGLTNRLSLTLDNLGNALYAEFPNASFFRPEAGRSVTVALVTGF